jgi:hypothetical protein
MKKQPNPITFAKGNAKIEKALIWNLPEGITCPGATELCKKVCYAKDSTVRFPNVVPGSRAHNLAIAKRSDFPEFLTQKLNRARLPRMRIHESGDFFNQKYLDTWTEAIAQDSKRTFWAYTKSHKLDFTEALKLDNFYIRYSVDCTTKYYPKQDIPHAAVSECRNDFFVCPSTLAKGHTVKCMKDCSYCTDNKESLTFRPHGRKAKLVGITEAQTGLDI